jgi:hypothetical protein
VGDYRPLTDVMILARPKVKYYGAYPAGFLGRARAALGVGAEDAVLHVCGGKVREYPFKGFGVNDKTVDLDPACAPDFLQDVREPLPLREVLLPELNAVERYAWHAVLIDRPYTEEDAAKYAPGADKLPPLNALLKNALDVVPIGGKVGVLDYLWPDPGKRAQEVFVIAVGTGRNARARWFTVWERLL